MAIKSDQFGLNMIMNSKIARCQQMTHLAWVFCTVFIICLLMKSAVASRAAVATLQNTGMADTASFGSEGVPAVDNLSGMADIASSDGENVPEVDKIPPNCHPVDHCGQCLCKQIKGGSVCCDG